MSKLDEMLGYIPNYYDEVAEATNIIEREADEITTLDTAVKDVLDQFFVDTATWGLVYWEQILGITTDLTKSLDERRGTIKSKLRGVGTVNAALIKRVAESFVNGSVEIVDRPYTYSFDLIRTTDDIPANTFYVRFVDIKGVPIGIESLKNAINEIKPAHLVVEYIYLYLTWDELDAKNLTWDQLDLKGLTWSEFEKGAW